MHGCFYFIIGRTTSRFSVFKGILNVEIPSAWSEEVTKWGNFPELFTFNYVDVCVSFSVALCSTVQWCAMYIRWHIVLLNAVERNFQHLQNILKLAVSSVHEWLQHLTLVLCVFHRQEKLVDDHLKICEWTCSVFDRALLVSNMILYLCLLSRINTGTGQLWYHHLVSTKC